MQSATRKGLLWKWKWWKCVDFSSISGKLHIEKGKITMSVIIPMQIQLLKSVRADRGRISQDSTINFDCYEKKVSDRPSAAPH